MPSSHHRPSAMYLIDAAEASVYLTIVLGALLATGIATAVTGPAFAASLIGAIALHRLVAFATAIRTQRS